MPNIVVVGTSCSGKSTLAAQIASARGMRFIDLDDLYWLPGWVENPEFQSLVESSLATDGWIVAGNYQSTRDIVWGRAQTLLFLDYSFPLIFFRAIKRTIARMILRTTCCNGNRESFVQSFLSKKSILLWVIQTYKKRREEYALLFQRAEYQHLNIICFKSPKETKKWFRISISS
jgi:adenylate kinase family enzyme